MFRWLRFRFWKPPEPGRDIRTDEQREERITALIDNHGFNVRVYLVAASGFFTDSYNLFATNVISPSLAYVFWPTEYGTDNERDISVATLSGSLFGMLVFGHLCDRYGRQKLYGIELLIVIIATLGMVQSSPGYQNTDGVSSMNFRSWIIFWRFVLGVGIGAEYPLSAVITAEWASKRSRARMLVAVFLMQPVGQLLAYLVGLGALEGISRNKGMDPNTHDHEIAAPVIDAVWRCVVGVGAFPALLAIIARVSIPESPRYTLLIEQNDSRAQKDAAKIYGWRDSVAPVPETLSSANGGLELAVQPTQATQAGPSNQPGPSDQPGPSNQLGVSNQMANTAYVSDAGDTSVAQPAGENGGAPGITVPGAAVTTQSGISSLLRGRKKARTSKKKKSERKRIKQFTWPQIFCFFVTEGNWRLLAGTSLCWFILDVGFYGLGMNNPRTISKIWMSKNGTVVDELPMWNSDFSNPNATIYSVLKQDIIQSLITVCIGSLLGSLLLLKIIKYIPRSAWLAWSFVALSMLFFVAGGSFFSAYQKDLHTLTLALYILSQFIFNLGPNTITFMIPAEIFPTRYRGTCHGIAAASGKLGSIVIQLIIPVTGINKTKSRAAPFAYLLLSFAALMLLGAVFAWAWIPDVQDERRGFAQREAQDAEANAPEGVRRTFSDKWELPSKTLEVLGQGKEGLAIHDGQTIGLRANLRAVGEDIGQAMMGWRRKIRAMFSTR